MVRLIQSKKISRLFMGVATGCITVNVMTLLVGVFSRYLLGSSPIWIEELSRYLMIGGVMLASGVVLIDNEHMRLNIIDRVNNKNMQFVSCLYRQIVTIGMCSFMFYFSLKYALSIANFTTMGLGISKTIPMLSLPIGFFSLTLYALVGALNKGQGQEENQ